MEAASVFMSISSPCSVSPSSEVSVSIAARKVRAQSGHSLACAVRLSASAPAIAPAARRAHTRSGGHGSLRTLLGSISLGLPVPDAVRMFAPCGSARPPSSYVTSSPHP